MPLVFPNFGAWDKGPSHGFARISAWNLEEHTLNSDGHPYALLTLKDNEQTRQMWNHGFELRFAVTLRPAQLEMTLQIENTGEDSFDFTVLLHTYFRVPKIEEVAIGGLKGLYFRDQVCRVL